MNFWPSSLTCWRSDASETGEAAISRDSSILLIIPLLREEGWRAAPGWSVWPERLAELLLRLRPIGLALRATPSAPSLRSAHPRLLSEEGNRFGTFLLSSVLKCLLLTSAGLAFGAICFSRYFVTPFAEWNQMW